MEEQHPRPWEGSFVVGWFGGWGHIVVDPLGRPCNCRVYLSYGILPAQAGTKTIVRDFDLMVLPLGIFVV